MRITDTMKSFLAGESEHLRNECSASLASQWTSFSASALAPTFALLWSSQEEDWARSADELLIHLIGPNNGLDGCRLERWNLAVGTGGKVSRSFRSSALIECNFEGLDLRGSNFSGAWLESVSFAGADLRQVDFSGASLLDVDVTDAELAGADLRSADKGLYLKSSSAEYTAERALGFLASRGASVNEPESIYIAMANSRYEIARKIARKLNEGGASQLMGLTQRGVSARDPATAQRFVDLLISLGFASDDRSGSARTIEPTVRGRIPIRQLAEETYLDDAFRSFFDLKRR